jgi:hypothetical protein
LWGCIEVPPLRCRRWPLLSSSIPFSQPFKQRWRYHSFWSHDPAAWFQNPLSCYRPRLSAATGHDPQLLRPQPSAAPASSLSNNDTFHSFTLVY